jgi:CTP synthase
MRAEGRHEEPPRQRHDVGGQFHPEFKTRPLQPHPLFRDFIAAAIEEQRKRAK